jgi:hypothetical protein
MLNDYREQGSQGPLTRETIGSSGPLPGIIQHPWEEGEMR